MSEQDPRVAFCHREHRRLVGALTLYCGDAELARDLAQEALARACRDWSKVSRMAAPARTSTASRSTSRTATCAAGGSNRPRTAALWTTSGRPAPAPTSPTGSFCARPWRRFRPASAPR
ncbi:hypothetical protein BH23ACT7_BH23ACT7_03670 [soil metagenome]